MALAQPAPSKPAEVRFKAGEKVEVLVSGEWTAGEVLAIDHRQYNVQLSDGTKHWMRAADLRRPAPPTPIGQPPKPGLVSCSGKIEGKYASASGFPNIVFHSGKASVEGDEEVECWTGGGKIYLHTPGSRADQDFVMDLLKDGSLDTPLGEIRKKAN
jgi:hypothetical protein